MRQAIVQMSFILLNAMADKSWVHDDGTVDYEGLRKALKLPDDCRIVAHNPSSFDSADWQLKIECSAFVDTPEGQQLPKVDAVFDRNGFLCWHGSAVEVLDADVPHVL